jgi:SAM-dependent methyltransferase
MSMEEYYRERAKEYDDFYRVARRENDLARLRAWVVERVRGRTILEIAAGTGYWTAVAAPAAKAITATDYNAETLAIAARRQLPRHVTLIAADAYRLPQFADTFDLGMAMLWWSHVEKQRRDELLCHFTGRLTRKASVLMVDQCYREGLSSPISRRDEFDNLYTTRKLANGAMYEIVKNYPTDEELRDTFGRVCEDIEMSRVGEFWALFGRLQA